MGRKKLTDEERAISRKKRLEYLKNYREKHSHEYYIKNKEHLLEYSKKYQQLKRENSPRKYNKVNFKGMTIEEKRDYRRKQYLKNTESKRRKKLIDKTIKKLKSIKGITQVECNYSLSDNKNIILIIHYNKNIIL